MDADRRDLLPRVGRNDLLGVLSRLALVIIVVHRVVIVAHGGGGGSCYRCMCTRRSDVLIVDLTHFSSNRRQRRYLASQPARKMMKRASNLIRFPDGCRPRITHEAFSCDSHTIYNTSRGPIHVNGEVITTSIGMIGADIYEMKINEDTGWIQFETTQGDASAHVQGIIEVPEEWLTHAQ